MKPFLAYKKRFKPIVLGVLILAVFVLPALFSYAQTASDLRNKITQKDSEITALEREIAAYQVELNELGREKDSLNVTIKELDITKKKLNADISVTQTKVDKTNLNIERLSSDIGNKEYSILNNLDSIILGIQKTNEFEQESLMEILLSNENFTTVWNDIDNIVAVREEIRDHTTTLRRVKGELEDTREETIKAKAELVRLRSELDDRRKIVVQNTNEKATLLKQTQNNEANYQTLLKDRVAKKDAFEKELREYESQLKFILDPSKLPSKGVLSWPLDYIFITSPFGPRGTGFHGGTDFRAPVGTAVRAMADGVVVGIGNTDLTCFKASFGQWIFIEYGNGLSSTFAHLSLIKVNKGDRVIRGQIVGYSGNTGSSTGPHLHVSLYASQDATGSPAVQVDALPSKSCPGKILVQPLAPTNAYLDPMFYLPPYKAN